MTAAPAPVTAPVPEVPASDSKVGPGTYIGWSSGGVIVILGIIDQMLKDHGELAATTLTKLGPIAGPVWGNWPIIFLGIVAIFLGYYCWKLSMKIRAATDAAAAKAAADLSAKVEGVATGLTNLGAKVEDVAAGLGALRADHKAQAEQTDERFRKADASLRDFIRAEDAMLRDSFHAKIDPLQERLAVLESHRPARKSAGA